MTVLERFAEIKARMAKAADEVGRDSEAGLVAVTKTFGADEITPVLEAGHRVYGENRVQEAEAKWPALREKFSGIELHLIGPLQSNKAAEAVALFDVIETVDREKIARALKAEMDKQARRFGSMCRSIPGLSRRRRGLRRMKRWLLWISAGASSGFRSTG